MSFSHLRIVRTFGLGFARSRSILAWCSAIVLKWPLTRFRSCLFLPMSRADYKAPRRRDGGETGGLRVTLIKVVVRAQQLVESQNT